MSGAANQQESEKESESESETESENQSESEIFQPETEPASGEIDDSRPDNGEANNRRTLQGTDHEDGRGRETGAKPDRGTEKSSGKDGYRRTG